jgi:hypothetical protein
MKMRLKFQPGSVVVILSPILTITLLSNGSKAVPLSEKLTEMRSSPGVPTTFSSPRMLMKALTENIVRPSRLSRAAALGAGD